MRLLRSLRRMGSIVSRLCSFGQMQTPSLKDNARRKRCSAFRRSTKPHCEQPKSCTGRSWRRSVKERRTTLLKLRSCKKAAR